MDIGKMAMREVSKELRHASTAAQLQREAAARPESKRVATPVGEFWMSPIEARLYDAMVAEGLSPTPQFCVEGYFVDFAFPDIRYAVEADGAAFHSGEAHQRDRKRDWILKQNGWTVQRFHGATIHSRAPNCAFVVKKEVEAARAPLIRRAQEQAAARARRAEKRRALIAKVVGIFRRKPPAAPASVPPGPPP